MTTELIKYDAACRALAECKAVDEVKSWADKAAAMQAYGRMAKDKTLEIDAAEIRLRAERRLGELIAAQKGTVGLSRGAAGVGINQHTPDEVRSSVTRAPTLADVGISYDLSSRAQKLAAVPAEQFEVEVAEWRDRVEAEGARVTARLEAAGAKALGKTAKKAEERGDRIAELEAALEEARDAAAEAGALAQDLLAQVNGEADQRLEQLRAELRATQATRDIAMRENVQLKRMVKALQRKLGEAQ